MKIGETGITNGLVTMVISELAEVEEATAEEEEDVVELRRCPVTLLATIVRDKIIQIINLTISR